MRRWYADGITLLSGETECAGRTVGVCVSCTFGSAFEGGRREGFVKGVMRGIPSGG